MAVERILNEALPLTIRGPTVEGADHVNLSHEIIGTPIRSRKDLVIATNY